MTTRIIDPQKRIASAYKKFVKRKYKNGDFPQFESTEEFFQDFFNTDLKLNDFKNMIGYVKRSEELFKHTGQKINPKTGQKCNYYKLKK